MGSCQPFILPATGWRSVVAVQTLLVLLVLLLVLVLVLVLSLLAIKIMSMIVTV